ncbi:MAG: DUF1592 domain-containing protein [Myxococcota bacterium]
MGTPRLHLAVLLALIGCDGTIADAPQPGLTGPGIGERSGPIDPEDRAGSLFPDETQVFLAPRVWRLRDAEYTALVEAAIGGAVAWEDDHLLDANNYHYSGSQEGLRMPRANVDTLARMADRIGAAAREHLPRAYPCLESGDDGCAESAIRAIMSVLLRGDLRDDQAAMLARFAHLRSEGLSLLDALVETVQTAAMLPRVVFRTEGSDAARMSGVETATALAYLLWREPPDAALLEAAEDGRLDDGERRAEVARTMMNDPRFEARFGHFLAEWLGYRFLDGTVKDSDEHPWYTPETVLAMQAEIDGFVAEVLRNRNGSFIELLTSQTGFAPDTLPEAYAGDRMDGERILTRAGLALMPGVIAARSGELETKPMKRAQLILQRLFCRELHAPDDVDFGLLPEVADDATQREKFTPLGEIAGCAGCHQALNPVAFALESYDSAGVYRTMDGVHPIDPSASMEGTRDPIGAFASAVELFTRAATTADAQGCFVENAFEAIFGIEPTHCTTSLLPEGMSVAECLQCANSEGADEECQAVRRGVRRGADPVLREAFEAFEASDYDMREVFVAFVRSDYFVQREARP